MEHIKEYNKYRLDESSGMFFTRHNYPKKYSDRVKKIDPSLSNDTKVLRKTEGFFQRMEDRIDKAADYAAGYQENRRARRGGGPNTGIESLFGIASIFPNILKRVFGPSSNKNSSTKYETLKDNEVNLNFMRHTNENFRKYELPNIRTEKDLDDNIYRMYKKARIKPKESPIFDEIIKNRANIFYSKYL